MLRTTESVPMTIRIDHPTGKANYSIVSTDRYRIAFSYQTPIAFWTLEGIGWTVRENDWGPTTGKHLNDLDNGDKAHRLPLAEFETALAKVITRSTGPTTPEEQGLEQWERDNPEIAYDARTSQ